SDSLCGLVCSTLPTTTGPDPRAKAMLSGPSRRKRTCVHGPVPLLTRTKSTSVGRFSHIIAGSNDMVIIYAHPQRKSQVHLASHLHLHAADALLRPQLSPLNLSLKL